MDHEVTYRCTTFWKAVTAEQIFDAPTIKTRDSLMVGVRALWAVGIESLSVDKLGNEYVVADRWVSVNKYPDLAMMEALAILFDFTDRRIRVMAYGNNPELSEKLEDHYLINHKGRLRLMIETYVLAVHSSDCMNARSLLVGAK